MSIADTMPQHTPNDSIPVDALKRPVAYHRVFREISGSTVAAVFLSQLWYWSDRIDEYRDGWMWKTQEEMERETGLSRREQETARKHLKEVGAIDEDLVGLPAKLHYRVNKARIAELIRCTNKYGALSQTGMAQSAKQDRPVKPNIHTENTTTESTAETTVVRSTKSSQIPPQFSPSPKLMQWCLDEHFKEEDVLAEVPQFVDYWLAKGEPRKDWDASFRTWMRNSRKFGKKATTTPSGNGKYLDPYALFEQAQREKAEYEAARTHGDTGSVDNGVQDRTATRNSLPFRID